MTLKTLFAAAILPPLALLESGCVTSEIVTGGERVQHYRAGVEVPAIPADENTDGIWVLTDTELISILKQ